MTHLNPIMWFIVANDESKGVGLAMTRWIRGRLEHRVFHQETIGL
jgi:hypothetical protein